MSAVVEVAFQWLTLMAAVLCVLRWPGRTLGLVGALALWPVLGPWATWTVLVVVVGGAVGWRLSGRSRGVGLLGYPQAAAAVVAGLAVAVGTGPLRVAGVAVLAGLVGWLARDHVPARPVRPGTEVVRGDDSLTGPAAGEWPPVGRRFLGRESWAVDFAPCERCGSVSVATARLGSDPRSVVARAVCHGCGTRLVGVESSGRLVWFEVPDGTVEEGIA